MSTPTERQRAGRRATAGLLALLLGAALAAPAGAAAWRELNGSYALTGAQPTGADGRSHLRVQLRGFNAREVYEALPGPPGTDTCTGGRLKRSGELRCVHFEDSGRYQCDFAIDLSRATIEVGIPC